MEISLRIASFEDLPKIVEIYNQTIPSRVVTADLEPVGVEDKKGWFYEHTHQRRPLWVVETGGRICGWVSLSSFYGRPAYDKTCEISIYLDENYRGRGIGKKVLEKVLQECPKYGVENLLAFIFSKNHASLKLFSAFGFEQWGYFPGVADLDGESEDLVILGKKITGAK
ncbi:MAG: N-acetyltransferase [Clostridiaceae bacterium]|nr:N-acetyltransferase [Clostridiaceae bacterium]